MGHYNKLGVGVLLMLLMVVGYSSTAEKSKKDYAFVSDEALEIPSGENILDLVKIFDRGQNNRLSNVQKAISAGDKKETKSLAEKNVKRISNTLKIYEKNGPHQRLAHADLVSAELSLEMNKVLVDLYPSAEGQKISTVANTLLGASLGMSVSFNDTTKKWEIKGSADGAEGLKKIKDVLSKKMDKKLWESLTEQQKDSMASYVVSKLSLEMQAQIPTDGTLDSKLKEKLEGRVKALGDKKKGEIANLHKKVKAATVEDQLELSLLKAEKKANEALAKKSSMKIKDYCASFASSLDNVEEVQRRVAATKKEGVCADSMKERVAELKKPSRTESAKAERKLAIEKDDTRMIDAEDDEHDSSSSASSESDAARALAQQAGAGAAETAGASEQAELIQQLQQALKASNAERDAVKASYINLACDRSVGATGQPLGMNADNERNQQLISGMKDELGKVIVDNMSAVVCQQSAGDDSVASKSQSARRLISGAGIPEVGPLTEAQTRSLQDISEKAVEQAGRIARKAGTRNKLTNQIKETAGKLALTRLLKEYPTLFRADADINYLRSLPLSALAGTSQATGSALINSTTDPTAALQTFNTLFLIALEDENQKNLAELEQFDRMAECSMTLAYESTKRLEIEANRRGELFGPGKQNTFNLMNSFGPTEVRNAPSPNKRDSVMRGDAV